MKTVYCLLLLSFVLASCTKEDPDKNNPPDYLVRYAIGCTDCMVIYTSDTAGTQTTDQHQNSSWTYSLHGREELEIFLVAYNQSPNPQAVTAKIFINETLTDSTTTWCPFNGTAFCVDTVR